MTALSSLLTIAALTVREAIRRKFIVAGVLICGFFMLFVFIPIPLHRASMFFSADEMNTLVGAIIASRGSSMVGFFSFLFAISLGAGTISGEIERGVMSVVVPKPIPRLSIYLGKYIGIVAFIVPFIILWTAMLQWSAVRHIGHTVPGLWNAIAGISLYPILFTALTMLFSSFTSTLLATVLPAILASAAWSEAILKALGNGFQVQTLKTLAKAVVYIVPLNPLSRWIERLIDQPILTQFAAMMPNASTPDPPANGIDLAWILGYSFVALMLGAWVFQRRDLA